MFFNNLMSFDFAEGSNTSQLAVSLKRFSDIHGMYSYKPYDSKESHWQIFSFKL